MYTKLSEIPAPAIAGVVRERTVRAAIAEIQNCVYDGASMIDLHLSCLDDASDECVTAIAAASRLPILALNYNKTYSWEEANLSEEERVDSLLRAVKCGCAGIDMQGYTFDISSKTGFCGEDKYSFTKGNPREIVTDSAIIDKQCALIEEVHSLGGEVLLSCHPSIVMGSDAVVDLALFLEKRKPDIIKIVTQAKCEEDLLDAIRAMTILKREIKIPISYHTSGKFGMLSRVINPALGGQIAFCVDRYNEGSTMEQIDVRTAKAVIDGMKRIM